MNSSEEKVEENGGGGGAAPSSATSATAASEAAAGPPRPPPPPPDGTTTIATTPPGISPPGMRLRSGRKKRRRSTSAERRERKESRAAAAASARKRRSSMAGDDDGDGEGRGNERPGRKKIRITEGGDDDGGGGGAPREKEDAPTAAGDGGTGGAEDDEKMSYGGDDEDMESGSSSSPSSSSGTDSDDEKEEGDEEEDVETTRTHMSKTILKDDRGNVVGSRLSKRVTKTVKHVERHVSPSSSHAAASPADASGRSVPEVSNLRLPSQRTPAPERGRDPLRAGGGDDIAASSSPNDRRGGAGGGGRGRGGSGAYGGARRLFLERASSSPALMAAASAAPARGVGIVGAGPPPPRFFVERTNAAPPSRDAPSDVASPAPSVPQPPPPRGVGINGNDDEAREDVEHPRPGDGLPRQLLRRASSALQTFTEAVQTMTTTSTVRVPEAERPEAAGGGASMEEEEDEEEELDSTSSATGVRLWGKTSFWVLATLALQLTASALSAGSMDPMFWRTVPWASELALDALGLGSMPSKAEEVPKGGSVVGTDREVGANASVSASEQEEDEEEEEEEESGDDDEEEEEEEVLEEEEPEEEEEEEEEVVYETIRVETSPEPSVIERQRQVLLDELLESKRRSDVRRIESALTNTIRDADDSSRESAETTSSDLSSASRLAKKRRDELDRWEKALDRAERAVRAYAEASGGNNDGTWTPGNPDLADLVRSSVSSLVSASFVPFDAIPFDAGYVRVPGEGCDGMDHVLLGEDENDGDDGFDAGGAGGGGEDDDDDLTNAKGPDASDVLDAPLDRSALDEAIADLTDLADSTASALVGGEAKDASNAMRRWIASELRDARGGGHDPTIGSDADADDGSANGDGEATALLEGLSRTRVDRSIQSRLEIDDADSNGKHDHASIRAGATVVRTGPTRTSLGISDNLPLVNRALVASGLRFYGHPAEAALSPTHPPDALGQCWSFEREGTRKDFLHKKLDPVELDEMKSEPSRGRYATLSVRLPKPIDVTSIALEHPTGRNTDRRRTAVKDFRAIGYADPNGRGRPWNLGAGRYDAHSDKPLQEFDVKHKRSRVPKLHYVTLAIDSNWGDDYACLYRFRVHGH